MTNPKTLAPRRNKAGRYRLNELSPAVNALLSALMLGLAVMTIAPVLLVLIISLSSTTSLAINGYTFFPSEWTLKAYIGIYNFNSLMVNAYMMTAFYTVASTLFSLFFTSMIAYAMSLKKFTARRWVAFYIYFSGVLGGGLVPEYILFTRYLHIDDTIWVYILPTMVTGFNAIVLRTFMQRNIPDSIYEAATIDGANDWTIFWRLAIPLSTAGLATIALFMVVPMWNNWFTGVLYIKNPRLIPIMTLLQKVEASIDYYKHNADVANTKEAFEALKDMPTESTRMAITFLVSIPLLIAYPFFQRYFIKGMTVGSVKG